MLAAPSLAPSAAATVAATISGETTRVSVDSSGTQANGHSGRFGGFVDVSGDGRFVVFVSEASNLVAGDTNGASDVFVRDLGSGVTELVSATPAGAVGDAFSNGAFISHDGRYVVFSSGATDLVSGDTNGRIDVFIRDRASGTTELVSVSSDELQGNNLSSWGAASADGRFVAFTSYASNLVAGDTNGAADIFVRDRQLGTTERVSLTDLGTETNGSSQGARISADGNLVFFESDATNVTADDTNGYRDVFVRDRAAATTERVSFRSDGSQIVTCCGASGASISADGRFVLFVSQSNVDGLSAFQEAYLHDRQLNTTERASLTNTGGIGNIGGSVGSLTHGVSDDGRFVVFNSSSTNMVADDTNGHPDVFVRDRLNATTTRVSLGADGSQGNGASGNSAISADGSVVAFDSAATNLVVDDTNGFTDVFVNGFVNEVAPEPGSVTIVKQTDPASGTGFTFTGPAGATPTGGGTLGQGGDSIVFYRDSQGLFLLDVATMTETALAGTAGAQDPEFSPDSSKIAFDGPSTTLGVFDVATEAIDVIVDNSHNLHASHPSWSPDGSWIVFHASGDLWVVPSDGSEAPTQLTNTEFLTESFPVWGPDGRIAWRSNAASPNVRVATFDGTMKTLVGETGLAALGSQHRAMHWSPDGAQLAAGAAFNSASDTYLYVLTNGGTTPWPATQLTSDDDANDKNSYHTDPTWRPDGSEIIFAGRYAGGDFDLYRVAPDGAAEAELFYGSSGTSESGPDWGQASTTSSYTLDHGDAIGGLVPAGESVTFAELVTDGYELQSIVCDSPSAVVDAASASVTVTPQAGEDVTCTFTNVPSISVPALLDSDGDGIADIIEIWLGCDPHAKDSDGDGLDDGTELWLGTDPTKADSDPSDGFASDLDWANAQIGGAISGPNGDADGDGVPDIAELFHGTDPDSADSDLSDSYDNDFDFLTATTGSGTGDHDGDGLPNGAEGLWGTDWNQADSDGNGQNDVIYIIHSCPAYPTCYPTDEGMQEQVDILLGIGSGAPDSDGDGLSDPFEDLLRTNPNNQDTDGDGWTDLEELVNGTPPSASLSDCATPNTWDPVPLGTAITLCVDLGGPGPFTGGFDWGDGSSDTTSQEGEFTRSHNYAAPGVYQVLCEIEDSNGARHEVEHLVVVYDPDGGFVTGGGWIDSPASAYAADPDLTGKATFGFVSKYKKGATIPTGNTEFQFKAGDLNFHSSSYQWLVVSGAKAKYKGVGTINGTGDYGFMLTATDSAINGGGTVDTFRIKIWDRANGDAVVYDNKMGESDDSDAGTALARGNIVIHTKK